MQETKALISRNKDVTTILGSIKVALETLHQRQDAAGVGEGREWRDGPSEQNSPGIKHIW